MHPVATTGSRPYRGSLRRPSAVLPASRGGAVGPAEASCGRPQPGPSAGHRSSPPGRGVHARPGLPGLRARAMLRGRRGEVSGPVAIARFLVLSVFALAIAVAPAAQCTTPRHASLADLTVAEPPAYPHDGGWSVGIVPAPDDGDEPDADHEGDVDGQGRDRECAEVATASAGPSAGGLRQKGHRCSSHASARAVWC